MAEEDDKESEDGRAVAVPSMCEIGREDDVRDWLVCVSKGQVTRRALGR